MDDVASTDLTATVCVRGRRAATDNGATLTVRPRRIKRFFKCT
ncbi:hypothetical protein [Streptomyces sp. NPDC056600]